MCALLPWGNGSTTKGPRITIQDYQSLLRDNISSFDGSFQETYSAKKLSTSK